MQNIEPVTVVRGIDSSCSFLTVGMTIKKFSSRVVAGGFAARNYYPKTLHCHSE